MKRQELEELGLTKEQMDVIMRINGADIENAKSVAISSKASEYEALKEQVGAADELRKQISLLKEQNKASEDAHAKAITQLKIDVAVEKALINAKARNTKAAKALLELGDAKLDENGQVVGLADKIKALTQSDDTKFLFESKSALKGIKPSEKSDDGKHTTNDIKNMNYAELSKFLEANPDTKL